MIINPYNICDMNNIEENKQEKTNIVQESVTYLADKYKYLLESKNKEEIKRVLNQKYIKEDMKINNIEFDKIIKEVLNKIFGYGILQQYIDDQFTTDIRAVAYNEIYIKRKGLWEKSEEYFKDKEEFNEYIRYSILKNGATINYEKPIIVVSDRVNHLRIEAGIDPVNIINCSLVIRIHKDINSKTMESLYIADDMITKEMYEFLIREVEQLKNILIVGKGGSGKTTLLRSIINKIPDETAISTNEETAELYLSKRNVIQREVLFRNDNKNQVDLELLTRHALVMSNDVIIIGELKGKESNTFFDAISTGHTGYTTIHADSVENSVDRLIVLIKKDYRAQGYTDNFLRRFITSSIDYVVFMKDYKIQEIATMEYNAEKNNIEKTTVLSRESSNRRL